MADNAETTFTVACDERTGLVRSVKLYGQELLDPAAPCAAELRVNGLPLRTRLHQPPGTQVSLAENARLKGERFVDHSFRGLGAGGCPEHGAARQPEAPVFRRALQDPS